MAAPTSVLCGDSRVAWAVCIHTEVRGRVECLSSRTYVHRGVCNAPERSGKRGSEGWWGRFQFSCCVTTPLARATQNTNSTFFSPPPRVSPVTPALGPLSSDPAAAMGTWWPVATVGCTCFFPGAPGSVPGAVRGEAEDC